MTQVILKPIQLSEKDIPGRVRLASESANAFRVRAGDILFNRTSETQDEVGLASVYVGSEHVVFGGFVIRGRPRDQRLDSVVAVLLLRAPAVRIQITERGQGVVRANIAQSELARVLISVPPKLEQQLSRDVFLDDHIACAIAECVALFPG